MPHAQERLHFEAIGSVPEGQILPRRKPAGDRHPARTALPRNVPVSRFARVTAGLAAAFDHELEEGNAFLFVPVFLAIGALWYFTTPQEPNLAALIAGICASAAMASITRSRPLLRPIFLALAMTGIGCLAAKIETWRSDTPMLGAEITTTATARVVSIEYQPSGRTRLTLDVIATERPALRYAPERIRATARAIPDGVRPGDVVQGVVRLMPPSGPVRPQSYDFSFRSYFEGIGAIGFFLSDPKAAAGTWPAPPVFATLNAWMEDWRSRMARRIEHTIGGAEGAIAAALITGIRAGIPEEINEALRIVGLYHVISISGLHMALVAGTVMLGLRCGFAFAPSFSMRRPVKKYAAAFALLASAFYLMMSGGDIAAQRSFLMLAIMLLAVIFDRAALTMRNLALSAIVILIVSPHEVVGPSFQMSFAATAALVAAYAAWTRYRERRTATAASARQGRIRATVRTGARHLLGLSMTSVVAGTATAIFTAWHFQQVSPMGLFANLAAMPVVSIIVMPMAVMATLLMPLGLDSPPLWLMGQGIEMMNLTALWIAERSAFDSTGMVPLSAVLALAAALAVLTMATGTLRWLAAPLVGAGAAAFVMSSPVPDVFVSEDGKLVALRTAIDTVAVNRARPREFTMQNWQRALRAGEIVRPMKTSDAGMRIETEGVFHCRRSGLCLARHVSGHVVAYAPNEPLATQICAVANLIVIDDATAKNPCAEPGATVITRRDLAQRGSAEVRFSAARTGQAPGISFAISRPYRPWHEHRRFSRDARGLPPYKKPERKSSRGDGVEAQ